ncbi:hypothetical protein [Methylobacterium sp. Leaf93]|uniref:hypothetical protein n=1 Tax=Methylobacterium sp. Leaf93 TaxID=1736249 RepID=UPI000701C14F|nr:hypothetical protein [Methylobacterium sp. Leaf93]KQP15759.1 hypothetical protein ASF26_16435 [Methylobacterium sp. Leaf93]
MSIGLTGISHLNPSYPLGAASSASKAASVRDVKEEFLKHAKMTLGEKIREQILKSMRLTEEQLSAMPPKEIQRVNDIIKEKIEELMKQSQEKAVGVITDIEA